MNCDCGSECLQLQFNIPSPGFEPSPGSLPTTRWSPPNSCVLALIDTGYLLDTARLARDRRWHTTIQQRQLRQTHSEFVLSFFHFESRVLSSFSPSILLRVISDPRSCSLTVHLSPSLSICFRSPPLLRSLPLYQYGRSISFTFCRFQQCDVAQGIVCIRKFSSLQRPFATLPFSTIYCCK